MAAQPDEILDLLAAYALDALEPEEMARVSEMLARNPELHRELAALRTTANRLPYALSDAEPPPELRQRVLDRAVGRTGPAAQPNVAPRGASRVRIWLAGLGGIAAAGLVAAAIGWAQVAGLRSDLDTTRAELEQQQQANHQIAEVLARPQTVADLTGPVGTGSVLRRDDGSTLIAANLPVLQPGRVYQLWLLAGEGAPISAGTFVVDETGFGMTVLSTDSQVSTGTFAITEEPGPNGSPGPTSPILLSNIPA